jgi:hypothetical protein
MRRRRAVQLARDDQAAEPPGGGSDRTWPAPWRGPVQPPLGLRRAELGAPSAAAQTAPWRPREWAGPPWQRKGPAVRPVELAPPGPACLRPRPSCDPVSWRASVTAKVPPAAASTVSPHREWDGGSLPLSPSQQMTKSEPCGAAHPLGRPPLAGRPPTRSACRTPPPSRTPIWLPGTPWPKRRWAGSPRPWRGRLPAAWPPSQPEPQVRLWRPRVEPQAQPRAGPYPPGVGSEQPLAPESTGSPTRRRPAAPSPPWQAGPWPRRRAGPGPWAVAP